MKKINAKLMKFMVVSASILALIGCQQPTEYVYLEKEPEIESTDVPSTDTPNTPIEEDSGNTDVLTESDSTPTDVPNVPETKPEDVTSSTPETPQNNERSILKFNTTKNYGIKVEGEEIDASHVFNRLVCRDDSISLFNYTGLITESDFTNKVENTCYAKFDYDFIDNTGRVPIKRTVKFYVCCQNPMNVNQGTVVYLTGNTHDGDNEYKISWNHYSWKDDYSKSYILARVPDYENSTSSNEVYKYLRIETKNSLDYNRNSFLTLTESGKVYLSTSFNLGSTIEDATYEELDATNYISNIQFFSDKILR